MADKCDPIRSKLHDLEEQLKHTPRTITDDDDGGPKHKPTPNPDFTELEREIRKTRNDLQACVGTLPPTPPTPPPPPVPLTLTLTTFVCLDQSDEINIPIIGNVEDDEPYAVVFAVDLKTTFSIPVGASNSKMTLVGPLADVDPGERAAPPNIIWGLSNAPDFVTSADDLIVLVAMMENDSGNADQVRTVLEKAAQVSLITNVTAFASKQIPRQELVNRIIADMSGAMGAAKVGVPDPDDNIGPIQELRFFQGELDNIYKNFGPVQKDLTFEGDDTKYVLKFQLFR